MNYMLAAVLVVIFTTVFLVIYKMVANPQVVLSPPEKMSSRCPDRWNYNMATGMCEPAYKTECFPFNPDGVAISSDPAKCNLAQSCGTFWSGVCP
jgi:hypothetical protein